MNHVPRWGYLGAGIAPDKSTIHLQLFDGVGGLADPAMAYWHCAANHIPRQSEGLVRPTKLQNLHAHALAARGDPLQAGHQVCVRPLEAWPGRKPPNAQPELMHRMHYT
nr:hypothetical protein CFP56_07692 [Quercus suber]